MRSAFRPVNFSHLSTMTSQYGGGDGCSSPPVGSRCNRPRNCGAGSRSGDPSGRGLASCRGTGSWYARNDVPSHHSPAGSSTHSIETRTGGQTIIPSNRRCGGTIRSMSRSRRWQISRRATACLPRTMSSRTKSATSSLDSVRGSVIEPSSRSRPIRSMSCDRTERAALDTLRPDQDDPPPSR